MPLFKCTECGCIENTACSLYWLRKKDEPALCSECDPKIKQWHGRFEKQSAIGTKLGNDGFLYSQEEVDSDYLDFKIKHQGFKIVGDA